MDPISGTWAAGLGREYLSLRFDGAACVTGTVLSGSPDNLAPIEHGTFNPDTRQLRLAGVATPPGGQHTVPFVIEARLTAGNYAWRDRRRLIAPGQGAATASETSDRT